ncbi:hypothetical protein N0V90_010287 [Kalmusia sp. IMI 367209]|nr:hypothetical protein N0V90_010287 [Kalmusia sp. IMI 367209]
MPDFTAYSFLKESIIANAQVLYGPQNTYDVVGSYLTKAILVAYSTGPDGSIEGVIKQIMNTVTNKGYNSELALKALHDDIAHQVGVKLRDMQNGDVFIRIDPGKTTTGSKTETNSIKSDVDWDAQTIRAA